MSSRNPPSFLYYGLGTAFCLIVVLSNILSAKMVPLPYGREWVVPVGLLAYPLTFLLNDLVTEFFGASYAKKMVYLTLSMNLFAWGLIHAMLALPGEPGANTAHFDAVLGRSGLRIFSSLVACSVAQLIDVQVYAWLKQRTQGKFLWVRANGATWISQGVDTVLLDMIFLWWGLGKPFSAVIPVMLFSFTYKALFSLGLTPLFYLTVAWFRRSQKA